jgi:hypothetical protein
MSRFVLVTTLSMLAGAANAVDSRPFTPFYPSMVTGDFELGLGVFDPPTGSNFGVFTGTARVNVPHQGSLNLEFQLSGHSLYQSGVSSPWAEAYGHAWHRLPSSAWGIFGGTQFAGASLAGPGFMTHAVGAEAKHYIGHVSLGGEGAYLWRSNGGNAWEVAGAANLYLGPNFRIGGGAQYVSGFTADVTTLSIDAEARFAASPMSIWVYGASLRAAGTTSYVALAGFKVFMDAPNSTLMSHEQDVPFWFHGLPPLF